MFHKWIWKYGIRRVARAHGFLDPFGLFLRLSRFGQPSEVLAPTELLRATAVLHARGLLNAQVIQHNLDWIWPFWVNRQFDPRSVSFVPRAFSLTHINMTHRNWTAVGLPNHEATPLVDPAGLVTPFWDSWSLDFWIVPQDGAPLIPSRLKVISQKLEPLPNLKVITETVADGMTLHSEVNVCRDASGIVCRMNVRAQSEKSAALVVSIRPYNPEGVSLVSDIVVLPDGERACWKINNRQHIFFMQKPQKFVLSNFHKGDVYHLLKVPQNDSLKHIHCPMEMATGAALFELPSGEIREIGIEVPIPETKPLLAPAKIQHSKMNWSDCRDQAPRLKMANTKFVTLFESSLSTILLHSAADIYAGPFIYKRFWFRDAAFITYALMDCGFHDRVQRVIDNFVSRQKLTGYFESQEGEWDSNGQVIWVMERFCSLTGTSPKSSWIKMIDRGARWIIRKRLPKDSDKLYAGLMPSGFSAEHFGPNDYYFWDDFWSIAGLEAAASLYAMVGDSVNQEMAEREAISLRECVTQALAQAELRIGRPAMPSSPTRRLDSASVGCLVAGYPLQLWKATDLRLEDTVRYLLDHCLVHNGFFHDMSHSGINPYLTLHIAQVMLRSGNQDFFRLVSGIADLASPTGQWPEAVHPNTRGGCMGDGQHVWAAAEWLLMIRNCFIREEIAEGRLVLGSGVDISWVYEDGEAEFGPVWTVFGKVSVRLKRKTTRWEVNWDAQWRDGKVPTVEVRFPDGQVLFAKFDETMVAVDLKMENVKQ